MKKINLFLLVASAILLISSCKKDAAETNLFINNGSVTGTISGHKFDQSVLKETFAFNKYNGYGEQQYYSIESGTYLFNINFSADDGSHWYLNFSLPNATSTSPVVTGINIDYLKRVGNSLFEFTLNNPTAGNTSAFGSDFTFDLATGRVKGKLTVVGPNNSANQQDTIVSNLDVTLPKRTN